MADGWGLGSMARCIWAPPIDDRTIEISYSDVEAGEAIVGYMGVTRLGVRPGTHPVELRVSVGDVIRGSWQTEKDSWFHRFELPVSEEWIGDDGTIDVSFQIRADDVKKRDFCFNAQVVDLAE